MALVIESPNEVYSLKNQNNLKIFIAGGITNCPDWQSILIDSLKDIPDITLYNPRRKNFPIGDPKIAEEQITWEYNHLRDADIIVFWFSKGAINPIVLYELGMWGNSRPEKKIIIGCDAEYERIQDVEIQSRLAGNNEFHFTLESISDTIKKLIKKNTYEN